MRPTIIMTRLLKLSALSLILAVLCFTELAQAQQYTSVRAGGRAGTWDLFLPLTYAESSTINGQGGSYAHIDPGWGLGFGFGYNITDRFEIGGLWVWNSRSYYANVSTTTGGSRRYSNWMNTSTLQMNGTFYFLTGKVTPFITGGLGITYIDTNIPTTFSGGPTTCWWDPWFGYVCDNYTPTRTENDFTYDIGLGVRFDLDRSFALEAGYYRSWVDVSRATGSTPIFDVWKMDLVFRMW